MNHKVYKVLNFYALTNGYIFQQKSPKKPNQTKTPHQNQQLYRFIAKYRQLTGEIFPKSFSFPIRFSTFVSYFMQYGCSYKL